MVGGAEGNVEELPEDQVHPKWVSTWSLCCPLHKQRKLIEANLGHTWASRSHTTLTTPLGTMLFDQVQTLGGEGHGFGEVKPIVPAGPVNLHCELHPQPPLLLGLGATLSQRP